MPDRSIPADILLVDDDRLVLVDLGRMLSSFEGLRLIVAASAEEALSKIGERPLALALIDVELPGKDGFTLAESLRQGETTHLVPIIFITGQPSGEARRFAGYELGAVDFLAKPVDPLVLKSKVRTFLELFRHKEQLAATAREYELTIDRLRRSEKALEQREQQYRAIVEFSTSGVAVFAPLDNGADFIIEELNPAAEELNRVRAEEVVGRRLSEVFPELTRSGLVQGMQRVAKTGQSEVVFHSLAGEGRLKGNRESLLYRLPSGEIVSVFRDVTERAAHDQALKSSEEQFRVLAESMNEFVSLRDPDGRYLYVSPSCRRLLGYEPSELIDREPFELVHPGDVERVRGSLHARMLRGERGVSAVYRIRHKDGHYVWFETLGSPLLDEDGRVLRLMTSSREVSDRIEGEETLRESERLMRAILDGIQAAIVVIDPASTRVLEINPVAERILGLKAEQVSGRPCHELSGKNQEEAMKCFLCQTGGGRQQNREQRITRADGRTVPVMVTTLTSRRGGEEQLIHIFFDLTERKDLERQLAVAQKLESIGQLASGIAHEINTPIQYVGDNLRFLKEAFSDLSGLIETYESGAEQEIARRREDIDVDFLRQEVPKAVEACVEGVERVATIVKAMRRFAHPDQDERRLFNVNQAIENTLVVAKNEWKYVADLRLDLAPELPSVKGYPGEFNQIILNIVVNAAHAIAEVKRPAGERGLISIATRRVGDEVEISIADTGSGIPEEHRGRIFDPFFTTKEVGKGTGQGLAIVYGAVTKHGGSIDFTTELGVGTTFTIRMPAAEGAPGLGS
jgi:PAS domain S-box-containing protein